MFFLQIFGIMAARRSFGQRLTSLKSPPAALPSSPHNSQDLVRGRETTWVPQPLVRLVCFHAGLASESASASAFLSLPAPAASPSSTRVCVCVCLNADCTAIHFHPAPRVQLQACTAATTSTGPALTCPTSIHTHSSIPSVATGGWSASVRAQVSCSPALPASPPQRCQCPPHPTSCPGPACCQTTACRDINSSLPAPPP